MMREVTKYVTLQQITAIDKNVCDCVCVSLRWKIAMENTGKRLEIPLEAEAASLSQNCQALNSRVFYKADARKAASF